MVKRDLNKLIEHITTESFYSQKKNQPFNHAAPFIKLHPFLNGAYKIYKKIDWDEFSSQEDIQHARVNYVINLVSYLESGTKWLFIQAIDKIGCDFSHVLKHNQNKVNVKDLPIIVKKDYSRGEFISEFINFQNLGEIFRAFSNLLDIDFNHEIRNTHTPYSMPIPQDFEDELKELIERVERVYTDIFWNRK